MIVRIIGKHAWGLQLIDTADGRRIDMPTELLDNMIEQGRIRAGLFTKGKVFVILPDKS